MINFASFQCELQRTDKPDVIIEYNEYHYVQRIYTELAKQITYKSNNELMIKINCNAFH
jgi:hypothetical protein